MGVSSNEVILASNISEAELQHKEAPKTSAAASTS